MRPILQWLKSTLGPQFQFLAQDDYRATLLILLFLTVLVLLFVGVLRVLLGAEGFKLVWRTAQESLIILAVGAIFSTTVKGISAIFPESWVKSLAEYVHEGLLVLVLAAIVIKALSRTCEQFATCRVVSERVHQRIARWI